MAISFVKRTCKLCGNVYFLHACMNAGADSGNCFKCDGEIEELEKLYGA
jgi:hypothetical protein